MKELGSQNILHIEIDTYSSDLEKKLLKRIENYLKESFGWHN